MIHISTHACERYRERVNPALSVAQAEAAIRQSERAIRCAVDFGASVVRLGSGQKLILEGSVVVTVLPCRAMPQQLRGVRA